ncbi:MAG: Rieske 2Fe-2S domain-containing protein [Oligoflexia bacterium]|nr:Rieske 2Fe-2S domain-containing protein [Oligoflexia bacterium]
MGIGSFLKGKLDKHGGPIGLAKHAVAKASGDKPAASRGAGHSVEDLKTAFENLPEDPDADGYIAVAPCSILAEGERSTFKYGRVPIAVFRIDGKLYVIDDECVHENGPLGEGELDGFVVTCPYHNWRYDVRNGDCLTDTNRALSCFSVKEADGYIWVGPRTRQGTTSRGGEHDDGLKMSEVR